VVDCTTRNVAFRFDCVARSAKRNYYYNSDALPLTTPRVVLVLYIHGSKHAPLDELLPRGHARTEPAESASPTPPDHDSPAGDVGVGVAFRTDTSCAGCGQNVTPHRGVWLLTTIVVAASATPGQVNLTVTMPETWLIYTRRVVRCHVIRRNAAAPLAATLVKVRRRSCECCSHLTQEHCTVDMRCHLRRGCRLGGISWSRLDRSVVRH
jgi:hypothetical protein